MWSFKQTLIIPLLLLLPGLARSQKQKPVVFFEVLGEKDYSSAQFDSILKRDPQDLIRFALPARGDTLVYGFYSLSAFRKDRDEEYALKGAPLPHFIAKDLKGTWVDSDSLRGKPLYINFWTITCVPCREEFPELNRLQQIYGDRVFFLSLSSDQASRVLAYLDRVRIELPVVPGADTIFRDWHIKSYPTHYFVNSRGIVEEIQLGTSYRTDKKTGKQVINIFSEFSAILDRMLASSRRD